MDQPSPAKRQRRTAPVTRYNEASTAMSGQQQPFRPPLPTAATGGSVAFSSQPTVQQINNQAAVAHSNMAQAAMTFSTVRQQQQFDHHQAVIQQQYPTLLPVNAEIMAAMSMPGRFTEDTIRGPGGALACTEFLGDRTRGLSSRMARARETGYNRPPQATLSQPYSTLDQMNPEYRRHFFGSDQVPSSMPFAGDPFQLSTLNGSDGQGQIDHFIRMNGNNPNAWFQKNGDLDLQAAKQMELALTPPSMAGPSTDNKDDSSDDGTSDDDRGAPSGGQASGDQATQPNPDKDGVSRKDSGAGFNNPTSGPSHRSSSPLASNRSDPAHPPQDLGSLLGSQKSYEDSFNSSNRELGEDAELYSTFLNMSPYFSPSSIGDDTVAPTYSIEVGEKAVGVSQQGPSQPPSPSKQLFNDNALSLSQVQQLRDDKSMTQGTAKQARSELDQLPTPVSDEKFWTLSNVQELKQLPSAQYQSPPSGTEISRRKRIDSVNTGSHETCVQQIQSSSGSSVTVRNDASPARDQYPTPASQNSPMVSSSPMRQQASPSQSSLAVSPPKTVNGNPLMYEQLLSSVKNANDWARQAQSSATETLIHGRSFSSGFKMVQDTLRQGVYTTAPSRIDQRLLARGNSIYVAPPFYKTPPKKLKPTDNYTQPHGDTEFQHRKLDGPGLGLLLPESRTPERQAVDYQSLCFAPTTLGNSCQNMGSLFPSPSMSQGPSTTQNIFYQQNGLLSEQTTPQPRSMVAEGFIDPDILAYLSSPTPSQHNQQDGGLQLGQLVSPFHNQHNQQNDRFQQQSTFQQENNIEQNPNDSGEEAARQEEASRQKPASRHPSRRLRQMQQQGNAHQYINLQQGQNPQSTSK